MISAIIGVVIAFNVSVYLVLATFLTENKRKAHTAELPELAGLVTAGNKKVQWTRARSSLAGRPLTINTRPLGMLRRLKRLFRGNNKEQLPLFSISCTDFTPHHAQESGLYKAHSWPQTSAPAGSMPPPAPLRRSLPPPAPMPAKETPIMSAAMTSATVAPAPVVMSAEPASAAPAARGNAADGVNEGLLRQALRMLYKQHYGVPSIMEKVPSDELQLHSFLEQRPGSPLSPLDVTDSLAAFEPFPLFKAAAGQPKPPVPGRPPARAPARSGPAPDLGAAPPTTQQRPPQPPSPFAAAASCPPSFFESEDMGQPMDGHRQVKSFERLVDSLVDLSVSSLVSSSLSRQHQQLANFGRASSQHRLIACA